MQTRVQLRPHRAIADTLALMRQLVIRRRDDARIRSAALTIVKGAPPYDDRARMDMILTWVRRAMPYERDPRGVEALNDPLLSLEKIFAYGDAGGDCDDAAVLIASLLESVGIRTRLAAVSIRRDRVLHHVAVEAADRRSGRWRYLDPYAPAEIGDAPQFTNSMRAAI